MPGDSSTERRIRRRAAARVVVVAGDELLLLGDTDPGIPGSRFWQAPGGGVEEGESPREAAVRELLEETGLVAEAADLAGPVAVRRLLRGYSDRILVQHETFYLLRTERFDPRAAGLTVAERARHVSTDWFPLDDLPEPTWPPQLAELAAWGGGEPVDLGEVEESTVPVGGLPDDGSART